MDYRFSDHEFEYRADENGLGVVTGIVVRYGEVAKLTPLLEEEIVRGAFINPLDGDWTVNRMHQRPALLGRTGDNLTLSDDGEALRFRLELADDSLSREVGQQLARGWLRGASIELGQVKARIRGFRRLVEQSTANTFALVDRPAYQGSLVTLNRWEDWNGQEVVDDFKRPFFHPAG